MVPRPCPILAQLLVVECCPFQYQGLGTAREFTFENTNWVNPDHQFVLTVDCMKMRRSMISVVHVHSDAIELANSRHYIPFLSISCCSYPSSSALCALASL